MGEDWTADDARRVLAMPLNRYVYYNDYDGDVRDLTYSNGTEADIAIDRAEMLLSLGPMLRRVLEAGVRALGDDAEFQAFLVPLYSGDSEALVKAESALKEQP